MYQDSNPAAQRDMWTIIFAVLGSGVIGSIIGSLITLIGVWRQNKANARRQKEQLDEQAKERKLDREMVIRRDIYLEGADALGKMQSYLAAFGNPSYPAEKQATLIDGVLGSLNKVAMIASFEALELLDNIQAYYSERTMHFVNQKFEHSRVTTLWKMKQEELLELKSELDKTDLEFSLSLAEQKNSSRALEEKLRELHAKFLSLSSQINGLQNEAWSLIQAILTESVAATSKFDELCVPLNCLVRNELGFPIEPGPYLDLLVEASARNAKLIDEAKLKWDATLETAKNNVL